jgi:hypothetical protein
MNQNRQQLRLQDGECLNLNGEKFTNMYQHRKMMLQKNMKNIKNMKSKKANLQKKKGGQIM